MMDLLGRVFVLNFGNMIMDGTPPEVQNNPKVIKAYLSEENLYANKSIKYQALRKIGKNRIISII